MKNVAESAIELDRAKLEVGPFAPVPVRAFHVMTKPIGPICNLDCTYCFYLEKEKLYPERERAAEFRMGDVTLEEYVRQYILSQDVPEITFAWQGGEPTLLGVAFFERAVELQKKYCPAGKKIANAFQTNGTLLDDEWCAFLKRENFLVGLSIDGPREVHDLYRVMKGGGPSFDLVMRGIGFLKKHGVDFNTLTVVNKEVSEKPLEVYRFLKEVGSGYMQFIPLVERVGPVEREFAEPLELKMREGRMGLPILGGGGNGDSVVYDEASPPVTSWSVRPKQYGVFLSTIFDEWVRNDVGDVFVQIFDVMLGLWLGMPASLCVFAETCGNAMALEHNGDLYSCDHFVYPKYKLGNILEKPMGELVGSAQQQKFGTDKRDALPKFCRDCAVKFACHGECPKHRFFMTPDGEPGLNYLCAGYKHFLAHVDPYMKTMAGLLRSGREAGGIMDMLAAREGRKVASRVGQTLMPQGLGGPLVQRRSGGGGVVGRNDACPCGSGKKFKKCCGR